MTRNAVYLCIDTERNYQDTLWPGKLTLGESLLLLEEYVAKARQVWAAEPKPETITAGMVRKIAGIAVRAMEDFGSVPER